MAERSQAGSAAETGAGRSNLTQRVLSAIVFVPGVLASGRRRSLDSVNARSLRSRAQRMGVVLPQRPGGISSQRVVGSGAGGRDRWPERCRL